MSKAIIDMEHRAKWLESFILVTKDEKFWKGKGELTKDISEARTWATIEQAKSKLRSLQELYDYKLKPMTIRRYFGEKGD